MADLKTSVCLRFEDEAPDEVYRKPVELRPTYLAVLRVLIDARASGEGLTMEQVRQRANVTRSQANNSLRDMRRDGLVQIIGMTPFIGRNRKPWSVYSATKKARLP